MMEILVVSHRAAHVDTPGHAVVYVGPNAPALAAAEGALSDRQYPGNIAEKNPTYAELTALHQILNLASAPIVGLGHYRRFFLDSDSHLAHTCAWMNNYRVFRPVANRYVTNHIVTEEVVRHILDYGADIILPSRQWVRGGVWNHFARHHHVSDLMTCLELLCEREPAYRATIDRWRHARFISFFNMFIARREVIGRYVEWLFPLMELLESRLDIAGRNPAQRRVYGFLAERLLNLYVMHHDLRTRYLRVAYRH